MKPLLSILLLFLAASSPIETVNAFVNALMNADDDAVMSTFADDATVFMPMPAIPRRLEGKAAICEAFAGMLAAVRSPSKQPPYFRLQPLDVQTQMFGDTAVVTMHLESPAAFSRRTFVLARREGRWLITHLHASNITKPPAP